MTYEVRKLHEVFTIKKGKKPDLHAVKKPGDVPYLVAKVMRGAQDPEWARRDDPNAVHVTEGEAIIICDGSNSGEVFSGFSGALSSTMAKIEPKVPIDQIYLRRFLESNAELFAGTKTGAAIPHLDQDAMFNLEIPLPPIPEQQRIVRLLDEAFEGISIARANAEKSRKSASEVYRTVVGESASSLALGIHPFNNKVLPIRIEKLSSLIASGTVKLFRGKIISKRDIARIPGRYPIYSSARDNDGKFGEYGEHMFDEELITWSVDGGGKLFHRKKHKFSVTNVGGILRILDQSIVSYAYLHMLLELRHSQVRFDWVRKAHPSVIRELYINLPIPSMDVQNEVVQRMSEIRQKGDALASIYTQKVNQFDLLKASLLNQVFESRLEAA